MGETKTNDFRETLELIAGIKVAASGSSGVCEMVISAGGREEEGERK